MFGGSDLEMVKVMSGEAITGVKIYWNDKYIIGLDFAFDGKSCGPVKGFNNTDNVWNEVFNIKKGEYIIEINGRGEYGFGINCIEFKTNSGLTKMWGNPCLGEPFSISGNGKALRGVSLAAVENLMNIQGLFIKSKLDNYQVYPFSEEGNFTPELGLNKTETIDFDDYQDYINEKYNFYINTVHIYHDGQYIYGLHFVYTIDGKKTTPGQHCGETGGTVKRETFNLAEGEHIVRCLVRAGEWIDCIAFETDHGNYFACGGNGGHPYLYIAPEGCHFTCVSGGTSRFIDKLRLYYGPITC